MIKQLLRWMLGIKSPSLLALTEGNKMVADMQQGMEVAAMGPHGPGLVNDDGSWNAEGLRIFLEETAPLVDRIRRVPTIVRLLDPTFVEDEHAD